MESFFYSNRQLEDYPVKSKQKPADLFTITNRIEVRRLVNHRLHSLGSGRLSSLALSLRLCISARVATALDYYKKRKLHKGKWRADLKAKFQVLHFSGINSIADLSSHANCPSN